MLIFRIERVLDPEEEEFAQRALYSRHPNMEYNHHHYPRNLILIWSIAVIIIIRIIS